MLPATKAHEISCSVNLALALATWFFAFGPLRAQLAVDHMDKSIYASLGFVHQDPETRHEPTYPAPYFAFLIPTLTATFALWLPLRFTSQSRFTSEFLRSGAGIMALIATPVVRLCELWLYGRRGYTFGVYAWISLVTFEVVLILVIGFLYIAGRWHLSDWIFLAIVALHYGFWFFGFHRRYFFGQFADPGGLCAASLWVLYLRQFRLAKRDRQGQ